MAGNKAEERKNGKGKEILSKLLLCLLVIAGLAFITVNYSKGLFIKSDILSSLCGIIIFVSVFQ